MRRRWVWLGVGAAVVLGGVGGFVAYQLNRTDRTTTERTLDEALDEFREGTGDESAASTTGAGPGGTGSDTVAQPSSVPHETIVLPSPGVYVYRTTGSDGVDALGGAEHPYPATTTITVRASGCGVTTRWDVAVERWEETSVCVSAAGAERTRFVSYHQFFGSGTTDRERCAGDPRPAGAAPGTTWAFTCDAADETTPWSGTVLDGEQIDVGGEAVMTDHVVLVTVDDPDDDEMRIETWFHAGTDLVVREVGERRTTDPSPIGDVHYREQYEIALTALEPLR